MAEITAALVKELRETTGAGMMDAKKALVENNGDMEASIDWLRTKGLAKAAKKSGRVAAEGLVAICVDGTKAAVVELNAETDFVARNAEFQSFVAQVAKKAIAVSTVEALAEADMGGKSIAENLTTLIAKIGENMTLRRMGALSVSQGSVVGYIHGALADNMGKIGVLVALESAAPADKLQALGKQIAMHVAAANPLFLDQTSVDPQAADRERAIFSDQARASGKPEDIIGKMVEGRMRKYYEEVCLVDQVFVMDGETRISQVIANAAKDAGSDIKLTGFLRVQLGEGIDKEEVDFAAEVAAVANG
jgi:elongation factor Ts